MCVYDRAVDLLSAQFEVPLLLLLLHTHICMREYIYIGSRGKQRPPLSARAAYFQAPVCPPQRERDSLSVQWPRRFFGFLFFLLPTDGRERERGMHADDSRRRKLHEPGIPRRGKRDAVSLSCVCMCASASDNLRASHRAFSLSPSLVYNVYRQSHLD